ncbi:hypothetical protein [Belnapia moabensis]|uniref:hypothetical protein n=1 Tax=Belnapia moabensis TaxID=365533 RepID=UPI000AEFADE1
MAHHLTNNASDQDALTPLLDAVTANTSTTPAEISADSGYCSEANLPTSPSAASAATSPPAVPSTPTAARTDVEVR